MRSAIMRMRPDSLTNSPASGIAARRVVALAGLDRVAETAWMGGAPRSAKTRLETVNKLRRITIVLKKWNHPAVAPFSVIGYAALPLNGDFSALHSSMSTSPVQVPRSRPCCPARSKQQPCQWLDIRTTARLCAKGTEEWIWFLGAPVCDWLPMVRWCDCYVRASWLVAPLLIELVLPDEWLAYKLTGTD